MARRLNYTGRRRIRARDVRIFLSEPQRGVSSFSASFSLDSYGFPADARLYVEAYRQASWMRFHAGTVRRPEPPQGIALTYFDDPTSVRFRMKVVQSGDPHAQLLGVCDRILPGKPGDESDRREPLLPVKPQDLGRQIWRVDIDDYPRLLVNNRLDDAVGLARDPAFVALVLPAAFREILTHVIIDEGYEETDDPDDWHSRWLLFASRLPGMAAKIPSDPDEKREWVEEAVEAFCRRHDLLGTFMSHWNLGD